ncbi:MAG: DUF2752 domain-containing protein [Bryobacterales bacterium]|nr:DUF2752 domain-containing protein [Bryobacterales bacterium]
MKQSAKGQAPVMWVWRRAAALAAVLFFLLYSPPSGPRISLCGFLWLTGRPCLFCGMTRALCALAKGEWQAAIRFHLLSPLVMAALITALARGRIAIGRGWQVCGLAFVLFGLVRALRLYT